MSSASNSPVPAEVFTGCVKWYNAKGYGFVTIVSENRRGEEVYVHWSALGGNGDFRRHLETGEYVEFYMDFVPASEDKPDGQWRAIDLCGCFGGNLMCVNQKLARESAILVAAERKAKFATEELERLKQPKPERVQRPKQSVQEKGWAKPSKGGKAR